MEMDCDESREPEMRTKGESRFKDGTKWKHREYGKLERPEMGNHARYFEGLEEA